MEPVVSASRLTAATSFIEGRLRTHSRVRKRFSVVFEKADIPIMARHPSQKIEEIGARLSVSSGLRVLTNTTGVPKYKMEGSIILFM